MKFFVIISVLCLGLLSGCFSPIRNTPPKTYLFSGSLKASKNMPGTHQKILLVLPVETDALYDTPNMLYTTQLYRVGYFIHHQWAEAPGPLLTALVVQTLQNAHTFKTVLIPPVIGPYDYLLKIHIQKIQQNFMLSPAIAELTLYATLYDVKRNTLIATKQWQLTQPLATPSPEGGVRALNQAVQIFLNHLIIFLNHTHIA